MGGILFIIIVIIVVLVVIFYIRQLHRRKTQGNAYHHMIICKVHSESITCNTNQSLNVY